MTISPPRIGPPFTEASLSAQSLQIRLVDRVGEPVWHHLVAIGTATKDLNHG